MTEKPPTMLLTADFDINQVGADLEWRFSRKDHNGKPLEGKDAGSIYFTKGEAMFVHVSGGGKPGLDGQDPFTGFRVLDCVLISRPQLSLYGPGLLTEFSPPSPFVCTKGGGGKNATINLDADKFQPWIGGKPKPGYYQVTQTWDDQLLVGQVEGRWELSFVITVEISWADGRVTERVFGFDPEGSVGTGMNPP
ncbi:MAG: hypothetical protein V4631_12520 [Pseudomonadota bacterium]